jgi:hypothetical protein
VPGQALQRGAVRAAVNRVDFSVGGRPGFFEDRPVDRRALEVGQNGGKPRRGLRMARAGIVSEETTIGDDERSHQRKARGWHEKKHSSSQAWC